MALTHEAVQEFHIEQCLGRHDTTCFFENRGDLLADILDHLRTHGKVIQHASRSQGRGVDRSQGEQKLHVSQVADISDPVLGRLLHHPLQQVVGHRVAILHQLPPLLHHGLQELPHPAPVLLAPGHRGRQLQPHDK